MNESIRAGNAAPASGEDTIKVVLYSHDSQGLGHVRRNLAIAHHLAEHLPELTGRQVSDLLISGLAPTMRFPLPSGFDWVTIPGVTKGKNGYTARNLSGGTGRLINLRSHLIEAALLSFAPDLVIIDRHIYGVWNELRDPLSRLREAHPTSKIVLGLREVLDDPHVALAEWEALGDPELMRGIVDEVWAYGDPSVHSMITSGEAPNALVDRLRFTGYLAHGRSVTDAIHTHPEAPYILSTAGGGEDGQALLSAAVCADVPDTHTHIVVTGPQMSEADHSRLSQQAGPRTQVMRTLPGLGHHIRHADAVIAMGGYNTVCEILATSTPALIIPREEPRHEQLIRAAALAEVGAVDYMRSGELTSHALSAWLHAAIGRSVPRDTVDRDGLTRIPTIAHALLTRTN